MYFPYLRGRQYELIALRELLQERILSEKIIPVIEPVKLSPTLLKTMNTYAEQNKPLAIVVNPNIGSFRSDLNTENNAKLKEDFFTGLNNKNVITLVHLPASEPNLPAYTNNSSNRLGIICDTKDALADRKFDFLGLTAEYFFVPDESVFRRRTENGKILLADKFNKQDRNNDYVNCEDEPFSDDHKFYLAEGYAGFSDYSIVGKEYQETGFAPYAVALHIVYFDQDRSLRIKHFVSDSNDDIRNPAGKFHEALNKLVEWNKKYDVKTWAMAEFKRLHREEGYPGLGVVKKLAIMHHIELMGTYLDK